MTPAELTRSGLDPRDRRFVTDLVYGTTRMRRACDAVIDRFIATEPQPEVRTLLRLGAYQLVFADVAPHAAVMETVALAPKRARGFVNAVLRNIGRTVSLLYALNTFGSAIAAFVVGSANFVQTLGIEPVMARALMGVLVASFAGTTLDTATRLQRYVVQELAATFAPRVSPTAMAAEAYDTEFERGVVRKGFSLNPLVWLTNTHGATLFAVGTAFLLALFPAPGAEWSWDTIGKGGLILWPLFGATNQLLAGLAMMVISFWLLRRGMPTWFAATPMAFMLAMPAWALYVDVQRWLAGGSWVLVGVGLIMLAIEVWMIIEACLLWPKVRGVLEAPLPPLPARTGAQTA